MEVSILGNPSAIRLVWLWGYREWEVRDRGHLNDNYMRFINKIFFYILQQWYMVKWYLFKLLFSIKKFSSIK